MLKKMKYLYSILVIELLFYVVFGANEYNFFPNLPTGKFKVIFIATIRCNQTYDSIFQSDYYFHKLSKNTSELRGSLTFKRILDDSYTININMAIKDSIGGWKDNAFVFKSHNACTTMKNFLGAEWSVLLEKVDFNVTKDCQILPGHYVSKGYDLTRVILLPHFPKIFFFGTYKVRIYFTDKNNKQCGCLVYIVEVLRPWESV